MALPKQKPPEEVLCEAEGWRSSSSISGVEGLLHGGVGGTSPVMETRSSMLRERRVRAVVAGR